MAYMRENAMRRPPVEKHGYQSPRLRLLNGIRAPLPSARMIQIGAGSRTKGGVCGFPNTRFTAA